MFVACVHPPQGRLFERQQCSLHNPGHAIAPVLQELAEGRLVIELSCTRLDLVQSSLAPRAPIICWLTSMLA
jgi:hypothetical protein